MAVSVSPGAVATKVAHNTASLKTPHWFKRSLATTDIDAAGGDFRPLYGPFPTGHMLDPASLKVGITDIAASAVVWDLGLGDVDGVIDTALITGSTDGTAVGNDAADDIAGGPGPLIDVGGLYLIFETTTAAITPAAGTLEVYVETIHGLRDEILTAAA